MIVVVRPGIASTFQDLGRPGLADIGVGAAGAVDLDLAALVNRLVGNAPEAAVIETCGDLELRTTAAAVVATSADLAPMSLTVGERLAVRPGARGRLWQYVAIRGGFDVRPVLGSASRDTLAGLGPEPLAEGQLVAALPATPTFTVVDYAPLRDLDRVARIVAGPRRDWFTDASWAELQREPWTVTTTSRVGVRFRGGKIERIDDRELPSEGLVRGAIQVPPGGEPVMMLADHPTTGGYPVIAVVHPDDVATVGQHSAGSRILFRRYG
jgi:biotin-dependent carboxylase-like uncharacterized protein